MVFGFRVKGEGLGEGLLEAVRVLGFLRLFRDNEGCELLGAFLAFRAFQGFVARASLTPGPSQENAWSAQPQRIPPPNPPQNPGVPSPQCKIRAFLECPTPEYPPKSFWSAQPQSAEHHQRLPGVPSLKCPTPECSQKFPRLVQRSPWRIPGVPNRSAPSESPEQ